MCKIWNREFCEIQLQNSSLDSSAASQALAERQSRFTVGAEMPRARAVSSTY